MNNYKSIQYHDSVPVSDKRLSEIREETSLDSQLIALKRATLDGWADT